MSMSGRETERAVIESFLHGFDDDSTVKESILYISGAPGTGKTALVNSVIATTDVGDSVKIIFMNCMALSSMDALWERLEEDLTGAVSKGKRGKRGSVKKGRGRDTISSILGKREDFKW